MTKYNKQTLRMGYAPYYGEYTFHLFSFLGDDKKKIMIEGLESQSIEIARGVDPGISFSLTDADAQALIDDLYNAGLRPSNTEGIIATKDAHLQDLRAIAFKEVKAK